MQEITALFYSFLQFLFALTPLHLFYLTAVAVLLIVLLAYRLRPKRFYFVRHGETIANKAKIKQGAEGGLTEKGKEQAHMVGLAFSKLPIDEICTSTYERAHETARIINEVLKKKLTQSALLIERRNAKEVIGKSTEDPEVKRVMGLTAYGYHADSYRFSDEENFQDLAKRAKKCLAFLEKRPGAQIMVVTHHAFLQMLISYMLYRKRLHASDYVKLAYFNHADNGGVTVCDFHPLKAPFSKTHGWEVISYNQLIGE